MANVFPRWLPMQVFEIMKILNVDSSSDKIYYHRYCNEAYHSERDKGRSRYREEEKISYWKKVLNCMVLYKMDFFFTADEIKMFLPTVLHRNIYPFVLSKPELILTALIESGHLMRYVDVLQSVRGFYKIDNEIETTEEKKEGWKDLFLSLLNFKKSIVLKNNERIIFLSMLEDLWIDFQSWLSTEMLANDNLLYLNQPTSVDYVLKYDVLLTYLRNTLGLHVNEDHLCTFIWFISKCKKVAIPFSIDLSNSVTLNAIKISLRNNSLNLSVTKIDECALVDNHVVILLQNKIKHFSDCIQGHLKKALESKAKGNTKVALIHYKYVKLLEQKLEEAGLLLIQLESSRGSREQANVISTVQNSLELNLKITKEAFDGDKILQTLDEMKDVNECIREINESFQSNTNELMTSEMNKEIENEYLKLKSELSEKESIHLSTNATCCIDNKNVASREKYDDFDGKVIAGATEKATTIKENGKLKTKVTCVQNRNPMKVFSVCRSEKNVSNQEVSRERSTNSTTINKNRTEKKAWSDKLESEDLHIVGVAEESLKHKKDNAENVCLVNSSSCFIYTKSNVIKDHKKLGILSFSSFPSPSSSFPPSSSSFPPSSSSFPPSSSSFPSSSSSFPSSSSSFSTSSSSFPSSSSSFPSSSSPLPPSSSPLPPSPFPLSFSSFPSPSSPLPSMNKRSNSANASRCIIASSENLNFFPPASLHSSLTNEVFRRSLKCRNSKCIVDKKNRHTDVICNSVMNNRMSGNLYCNSNPKNFNFSRSVVHNEGKFREKNRSNQCLVENEATRDKKNSKTKASCMKNFPRSSSISPLSIYNATPQTFSRSDGDRKRSCALSFSGSNS